MRTHYSLGTFPPFAWESESKGGEGPRLHTITMSMHYHVNQGIVHYNKINKAVVLWLCRWSKYKYSCRCLERSVSRYQNLIRSNPNHYLQITEIQSRWPITGELSEFDLRIQWNLWIKDTLGSTTLSSVERLSFSRQLKMYYCYGKEVQKSVLCREVVPFLGGSVIGGSTVFCVKSQSIPRSWNILRHGTISQH